MMKGRIQELYALEQLSGGDTCIHRLHPTAKLVATAVFVFAVVSFDRYAVGPLTPYVFFPTLMMALSETPYSMLLKRFLLALPFCLFAGAANLFFDRAGAFSFCGFGISYGAVSFFAILLRAYLCVMAVMVLVSVTPLPDITDSMRRLWVPRIFVAMFEMIYRYIGVLLEEAHSMHLAYSLRRPKRGGIEMGDMGSFVGQLLLRSFDRADRVYSAMKCRGYGGGGGHVWNKSPKQGRRMGAKDLAFCAAACLLFIAFRIFKLNVSITM